MNPVIAELLVFAGRRAFGAIVSCAAIMAFKAALDTVKNNKSKSVFNNIGHTLVDGRTGEIINA